MRHRSGAATWRPQNHTELEKIVVARRVEGKPAPAEHPRQIESGHHFQEHSFLFPRFVAGR